MSQRFLRMARDTTSVDGILPPLNEEWLANPAEFDEAFTGRTSSADVFLGNPLYVYQTRIPNLEIIPGEGDGLRRVEMVTQEQVVQQVHNRMRDFLRAPEIEETWDLVVIDTSPSKGPLTMSAIRAATDVLIPTSMEPQGVEGLQGMLSMLTYENRLRDASDLINLIGILPNKFRRGVALHEGLLQSLTNDPVTGTLMIPHKLGQRTAFAEADHESAEPKSVLDLSEKDAARIEAEDVINFVMKKLGFA